MGLKEEDEEQKRENVDMEEEEEEPEKVGMWRRREDLKNKESVDLKK